ncbi:hypothetical protein PAMA_003575 [Pampus argenteus]
MGTQGTGRKRSSNKERSTAEDDALNLIAREAEARLAAKRAARAEAREIRMKELERQQKEVEDKDYLEKGSRAASALTAATLTSLGGSSSRRGSGETAVTVDETSLRDIKEIHELKDQIQDVETRYTQNLKEVKEALAEVEEKYRKAMVSNAQLDNEKNNLMYQVDTLKDSLMELEELLSESNRGYEEKVKEYEREKHAHSTLQFQFNEMKETLKQSEELLNDIRQLRMKQDGFVREISDLQETVEWKDKKIGALERQKEYSDAIRIERDELREEVVKLKDVLKKHGIVLGPDLNVNGDVGETEKDGTSSGDAAQDPQTSPTEGNSMLGSTELRSSGEEEVHPEQHRENLEEAENNQSSSDMPCNVSAVEISSKDDPTEEQQTCLSTAEDCVEETESNNLQVDINPVTETKDVIVCSPELQDIVTPEENVPGTEILNGGDSEETGTKSGDDVRETCDNLDEVHGSKQEDVEESLVRNTVSCYQQKVTENVMKEPDESVQAVTNTEAHQEPENTEEAENDEADEISSKSQLQGATASGKKKKRKRRGKKKGGPSEEKSQQKDAKEENRKDEAKTEKIKLATRDNGSTTEPDIDVSVTETLKESKMDDVMSDAVDVIEGVESTETCSHIETLNESRVDQVIDEQKEEQSVETETVEVVEAPTEMVSVAETFNESRTDHVKEDQDTEQTSETKKADKEGSETSPDVETNVPASDLTDDSKGTESTDALEIDVDNSESGDITTKGDVNTESGIINSEEDKIRPVDEMKSESATENPENTFETTNCKEDTEAESHVPSNADDAVDKCESTNNSETKVDTSAAPSSTDDTSTALLSTNDTSTAPSSTDAHESLSGSELPAAANASSQEEDDNSELKLDRSEKEENVDLREDLVEPDGSSHDEKRDTETEKSPLETVAQAEHLDNTESQIGAHQIGESNAEGFSETEQISASEIMETPDSPKEAAEIDSLTEREPVAAEDPEHKISQNEQESEKCQQESNKDKSEDDESSQPTKQDSDKEEEEEEEDEGQSFDFEDMDVDAAIDINSSKCSEQEEVEEGVEVMSDESNDVSSSNIQSNEKTQDQPIDEDEKSTVDEVDAPDKESKPRDDQDSLAHEETTSENVENELQENVSAADIKEGEVVNVVESNSTENINQATSLPVEEAVDAIKHELQGEVLPKSSDQAGSNKEPPLSGKDVKKNGKKGKSKGKEDCKMS